MNTNIKTLVLPGVAGFLALVMISLLFIDRIPEDALIQVYKWLNPGQSRLVLASLALLLAGIGVIERNVHFVWLSIALVACYLVFMATYINFISSGSNRTNSAPTAVYYGTGVVG